MGRERLRWTEAVENDLRVLNMLRRRQKASINEECPKSLKDNKVEE
jgi:hypothetical protein